MRVPLGPAVRAARSAAVVLLVLLVGCEAVPTLTFEGPGDDASAGDAGAACPTAPPQNAKCCGSIACYGSYCTPANCALCMKCSAGESCCTKNANVPMCLQANQICH